MIPATESEWLSGVRKMAGKAGWKTWHFHDSRRQAGGRLVGDGAAAGYPDLTLVHPRHGVGFVELKTDTGRLTPLQKESLQQIANGLAAVSLDGGVRSSGLFVHVWRPADLATIVLPVLKGETAIPRVYGWEPHDR